MRTRLSLLLALIVPLSLAGCATASGPAPDQEIERRLSDLPGVVSASAETDEGDDDIPFAQGGGEQYVTVEMAADATADQVLAIFDELHGEVVVSIEVRMAGPKVATLTTGGDLHDSERLAEDLVTAYGDGEVFSYERVGFGSPTSYVSVRLELSDFDHVVAAAGRYGDAGDPDEITVVGGRFRLDRVQADHPELSDARARFVQRIARDFHLEGAVVSGHGPLELWTRRRHRDALRVFVVDDPEASSLGTVVVGSL